jgi:undecaprenyl-diphosphatase
MFGLPIPSIGGSVGYPLLFGLVMGESAGLPIPGESSIMLGAIAASQGSLSIEVVLAVAIAAAIVGDNLGYLGGRLFGRRVWTAGRVMKRRREQWLEESEGVLR